MFFSASALHVKVAALGLLSMLAVLAVLGLLSMLSVPTLDLRLHRPEIFSDALLFGWYTFLKDEIPREQIAGFVRGVYFALKRRGIEGIQALTEIPLFLPVRAKTRESGAFYVRRPARNAEKSIGFKDSDR